MADDAGGLSPGLPAFVNAVVAFVPRQGATPESMLLSLQEIEREYRPQAEESA